MRPKHLCVRSVVTLAGTAALVLGGAQVASASTTQAVAAVRSHQTVQTTATFAVTNEFPMLALMQMGYDVKCAVTNGGEPIVWPSGGDGSPPLGAQIAAQDHTQVVGGSTTNGFDYDELAQCAPNYIIDNDRAGTATPAGGTAPVDPYPTITAANIATDAASTEGVNDAAVAPTLWVGDNFIQYGAGNGQATGTVDTL
jgi:hypothetical protein